MNNIYRDRKLVHTSCLDHRVVMNSMNSSLIANTEIVKDIDKQLKSHLVDFNIRTRLDEAYINKGKGVWKVLSWCLVALQMIIIGFVSNNFSEIKTLHAIDQSFIERLIVLETEMNKKVK